MNEETVKNSIIMPYFKSLGFDVASIEYETTFSIKLGKHTYSINGNKEKAVGRLDILFKRNGENLFVVETKSQDHHIDEADRTQAISYARLLDKIAPFAVVTNGIETEIYDVISNKRLSNDNLKDSNYVNNSYKVALSPELRYQALKNFIGLNVDNLNAFCKKQIAANMQGIIANEQDKEGKFIPEIFLQREGIKTVFDSFLMSDRKIFSIVAESGFGKTNAICDLAIQYSQTNPTLFFNGSQIARDLLEEIAYEFNWDFGGGQSGIDVIKRMAETLIQFDKDLIIFIDAIDEFPNKDSKVSLNSFIKHCPARIKLCVSCKETVWPEFLTLSGIRSSISDTLFVKQEKANFSFTLKPFLDGELDGAIEKYRKFFELPKIEGSTKALCSNPLMLRALSEVYSAKSIIPNNLITATVTNTFLDKKFEKRTNPEEDRNFLSSLGRLLFEGNKEMVFEDEIPGQLNVPNFLVEYNLLRRTKDDLGRCLIGFQYDHIRDFVMCFYSFKLDKLSDKSLDELVKNNIHAAIPRSVFTYYERIAENNSRDIIRKEFSQYHSERAEEFIEAYQHILDSEFPVIRELFEPYSKNTGLLVFYSMNYLHPQYSFREVKAGEPKVVWLENEDWHDKELETEITKTCLKYKIRSRVSASHDFTVKEPSEYARERIILQLKHLIENRVLYEDKNDNLMIEYILQETRKNASGWGLSNNWRDFSWASVFPLNLDKILNKVENDLKQMSLSCRNILHNMGISDCEFQLPPELLKLCYHLEIIRKKQETIEKHLLPFPSKGTIPVLGAEVDKYTDEEMIEYLSTLFQLFLSEYKILVETNFPNLKDFFETYRLLPTKVICEIEKVDNHFRGCTYCLLHSEKDEVYVKIKGSESIFDLKNSSVMTKDGKIKLNSFCPSCAMHVFFWSDSGKDNVIQRMVYERLLDDLEQIYNWNRIF